MAITLDLSLVNAALTRTSNDAISTLDVVGGGSAGAKIAAQNYEKMVLRVLSEYPWKFATKTEILNAIEGVPLGQWGFAYELPTDVLKLRTVEISGVPITYERQSNKVLCDEDTTAVLVAKYTWRPPERDWPDWFQEPLIQELEAMFLRGIGERYDEGEAREKSSKIKLREAKHIDSGEQSTRNPWKTSPTLSARGGFVTVTTPIPWR